MKPNSKCKPYPEDEWEAWESRVRQLDRGSWFAGVGFMNAVGGTFIALLASDAGLVAAAVALGAAGGLCFIYGFILVLRATASEE